MTQSAKEAMGEAYVVVEGEGNFFMVLSDDARLLQSELMEQGVVVRQFMHPEKGHVLNRLLRISIGSPEQNACLLSALKAL